MTIPSWSFTTRDAAHGAGIVGGELMGEATTKFLTVLIILGVVILAFVLPA